MKLKLKPAALATLALLSGVGASAQAAESKADSAQVKNGAAIVAMQASGVATALRADDRKPYIVLLKDEPAASYQGGLTGYVATQPAAGQSFKSRAPAVQAYVNYLSASQDAVAATVPQAEVRYKYSTVLNGFAASLSDDEVASLVLNPKVASVTPDEARKLDTISTPRFLGLDTAGGVWSQSANGVALKGEDMVIGVVDGGIWPENPSVFDQVDASGAPVKSGGTLAYGPPPATFHGGCVDATGFVASRDCNNKLIGAKAFDSTFKSVGKTLHWTDFASSPRDSLGNGDLLSGHGGHGDHTASTAAGNAMNPVTMTGVVFGPGSGMAPRARIAAYKVCWTYADTAATDGSGSTNSCYVGDSVAAIDQAVADGVNAINFSISGSTTSVNDLVEQAFYRASLAGVFVATSAGNSGPGNTVAHLGPWETTVAASTHDRFLQGTITLGNAATFNGASLNTKAVPQTATIRAEDAGMNGGAANLCFSDSAAAAGAGQVLLDPAKVNGKVVICTRGNNARVDKSLAVFNAGGVGMIMADNGSGLVAEAHSVPTIMVSAADGATIKTYAQGSSPTAALSAFSIGSTPAPIMANFSSRGPNLGDANVLKPDLTAPGVDVIAQVTPPLTQTQRDALVAGTFTPDGFWLSYQGTSMASPHVAGASLLVKQAHPSWSPAAIKSALMTSAYTTLNDGLAGAQNGLLPWSQGAGHINPAKALDPGLVYDAGKADYVKYQCLVNKTAVAAADCTSFGTLDFSYNLNLPSITVGSVSGSVTVRRSVTNVGTAASTYTATASVPGFTATVTPASLTLNAGETKSFTLQLTGTTAVKNVWNFGKLTWSDATHSVVSPVQAKLGESITAPAQQTGNTASGSRLFTVQTGFAGKMGVIKAGLNDVTLSPAVTLAPKSTNQAALLTICKAGVSTANVAVYPMTIPAGALAARFALRQQDTSDAADDNDMMVLYPNGTTNGYSANDGSNEAVQITLPTAGTYKVCVVAYGGKASMTHQLSSWIVNQGDSGGKFNVVLPAQVYSAGTSTVGISWSSLPMGHRYLGAAAFTDAAGNFSTSSTTVVRVETNGGLPVTEAPTSVSDRVSDMKQ